MHTLYDVINMIAVRNVTDLMDLDHLCHHSVMFMSVRIITNSETQQMHTLSSTTHAYDLYEL